MQLPDISDYAKEVQVEGLQRESCTDSEDDDCVLILTRKVLATSFIDWRGVQETLSEFQINSQKTLEYCFECDSIKYAVSLFSKNPDQFTFSCNQEYSMYMVTINQNQGHLYWTSIYR
jgi:hypothetical protein